MNLKTVTQTARRYFSSNDTSTKHLEVFRSPGGKVLVRRKGCDGEDVGLRDPENHPFRLSGCLEMDIESAQKVLAAPPLNFTKAAIAKPKPEYKLFTFADGQGAVLYGMNNQSLTPAAYAMIANITATERIRVAADTHKIMLVCAPIIGVFGAIGVGWAFYACCIRPCRKELAAERRR